MGLLFLLFMLQSPFRMGKTQRAELEGMLDRLASLEDQADGAKLK